jgi:hypothetical protein
MKSRSEKSKRRLKRAKKRLFGACLSASLATAWGGSADAATIHLSVSPTEALSSTYALYRYKVGVSAFYQTFSLGSLLAGKTTVFDHDVPDYVVTSELAGYAIVGLHGNPGSQGVSVSFIDDSPIQNHTAFATLFPPYPGFNEQTLIDFLPTDGGGGWASTFVDVNNNGNLVILPYESQATIVNFTDPTFGGVAFATLKPAAHPFAPGLAIAAVHANDHAHLPSLVSSPLAVPEPASLILFVTGAGVVTAVGLRRTL